MTGQLFKNAAVFTDIHYGLKQNSEVHLKDCSTFIDWFIAEAKARNCETCLFLGDWMHHRATINVKTMNYALHDLKKLNDAFEQVFFITGNHDLYYRDKRDLNSLEFIRDFDNVTLIDTPLTQEDVVIVPWLVGDEWKKLKDIRAKYIFGHFELPHFKMNAMIEMPDSGQLNTDHFSNVEYVFSGHFHKRQKIANTHYIGNAFPHNYSDVNDWERGAMFLEWDHQPVYVNWPACPKYKVIMLSDLLANHESLLDQYTYARIRLDIDITYEESNVIREQFVSMYNVRELKLMPIREEVENFEGGDITFESVDQIVLSQIETIDSETIDKARLASMYNEIII